jgi:diaminopimelate decarboxylase
VFNIQNGVMHCEAVSLKALAQQFGTPLYVYSESAIAAAYLEFANAAKSRKVLVCFGMKANSNLAVLSCLNQLGAGFDIVSQGEMERVLRAGAPANKIVFSGVGKSEREILRALEVGIKCFNVESEAELARIQMLAASVNTVAPISIRINPEVDAGTHPYISTGLKENKFGIEYGRALAAYQFAAAQKNLKITGIDCHIGSQITESAPFLAALHKMIDLYELLQQNGIAIEHLDFGGGLGINYNGETPPDRGEFLQQIFAAVDTRLGAAHEVEILFEFGRSIVGNAGVLLTTVEYLKSNGEKNFAIVDAAMNDLLRPTLYQAFHQITPVETPNAATVSKTYDVVGPVCESGDWLGKERVLAIEQGSLLAIHSAGAYGIGMSSNYNTRNRAAEILVKGDQARLVRERETFEHQLSLERP